jgi:hypothetical protein
VNEAEWLSCAEPTAMLESLAGKVSSRKLRLFACAGSRAVWHQLSDERCRKAAEAAERFADGERTKRELANIRVAADQAQYEAWSASRSTKQEALWITTLWPYWASFDPVETDYFLRNRLADGLLEKPAQAALLREVLGNPFPAVVADPSWSSKEVRSLAEAAYRERSLPSGALDPVRLSVLADALEDAGAEGALVGHLRSRGPHVRGCFAVDCVLGKG